MKPIQPRPPTVMITDHAHLRWLERADRMPYKRTTLALLVASKLFGYLRTTGIVTDGLVVELDMGGIRAVLELTDTGWVCKTFIKTDESTTAQVLGGIS